MPSAHTLTTPRHTTYYLSDGPADGIPIIFVHGWPELSHSWRNQLPAMADAGFRAIAPDMRGYGKSATYPDTESFRLEESVTDMVELLEHLGAERAIWVGHDWGAPVVWALAQQHPEKCLGVACLCVPYFPEGLSGGAALPLINRNIYPQDTYPLGQWDYFAHYEEDFDGAVADFEADPAASVRVLFRAGSPDAMTQPAITASVRANGGWFGGHPAPNVPRDPRVISAEDEAVYAAALAEKGFAGPARWYLNGAANAAYARKVRGNWTLNMPVLFVHARYDMICETLVSRLADPMRDWCADLTEEVVDSGHWMAQEKPDDLNAALTKWITANLPRIQPD